MAQRIRRKKSRIKSLLVYLFVPLGVWLVAFVIWLYWHDLRELFVKDGEPKNRPKATRRLDKDDKAERENPPRRSPEKIFDEERKKLDDIIKRQQ